MWQRNSTYRRWLCVTGVLEERHFRRDSQRCSLYLRWLPLAKDGELEHHKENELAYRKTIKRGVIWTWVGYPEYTFARIVIALKANSMQRSSVDFIEWKAFSSCSRFPIHSSLPAKSPQKVNMRLHEHNRLYDTVVLFFSCLTVVALALKQLVFCCGLSGCSAK